MKRLVAHILTFAVAFLIVCQASAFAAIDREQEVRDAVSAFVASRTSGLGWDVRVRRISIPSPLELPAGKIDYEVVAPQQWAGWGNISVAVLARHQDRVVQNIPVRLDVEALADTVITLHQVEYGNVLTADDVALQKREITYNSHLAARTLNDVIGKKARTTLRGNQPVRSDQVENIPLIKSGQMVTIVAENEVLKISVSGKAHSSGAEGDIIRVQNLTSQKEIPARVINATTVQVAF